MRDIQHEQVSTSTTEELLNRKAVLSNKLNQRFAGGLRLPQLSEYHKINSELYCREKGIQSQPWRNYA